MVHQTTVKVDAPAHKTFDRVREIVGQYDKDGYRLAETIEVEGTTVGLVFVRDTGG